MTRTRETRTVDIDWLIEQRDQDVPYKDIVEKVKEKYGFETSPLALGQKIYKHRKKLEKEGILGDDKNVRKSRRERKPKERDIGEVEKPKREDLRSGLGASVPTDRDTDRVHKEPARRDIPDQKDKEEQCKYCKVKLEQVNPQLWRCPKCNRLYVK